MRNGDEGCGVEKERLRAHRAVLAFIGGALVAAAVFFLEVGRFGAAVALADGAFVAAVLLLAVYFLARVSAHGGFDIFAYSFLALYGALLGKRERSYAEYKEGRKRPARRRELLFSGLIFLGCSVVMSAAL